MILKISKIKNSVITSDISGAKAARTLAAGPSYIKCNFKMPLVSQGVEPSQDDIGFSTLTFHSTLSVDHSHPSRHSVTICHRNGWSHSDSAGTY